MESCKEKLNIRHGAGNQPAHGLRLIQNGSFKIWIKHVRPVMPLIAPPAIMKRHVIGIVTCCSAFMAGNGLAIKPQGKSRFAHNLYFRLAIPLR